MLSLRRQAVRLFIVGLMVSSLCATTRAWEPNAKELDAAIAAGGFSGYLTSLSAWVGTKVPADTNAISEAGMQALIKDPAVLKALTLRHFIAKCGSQNLDAFAAADPSNKAFLTWLLNNTEAMDLCLIGATPNGLGQRADNSWSVPPSALAIWKRIYDADADSKSGLYLKLAIAVGLNPPGTGERGAGQAEKPADPLARYNHYKSAHKNGELFPTFDTLTVWDLRQVVKSNASDADLAWGREMVNTWRPDLRNKEQVVVTTSSVWRRNSPIPHDGSFKNVLSGGGKCGPRSSWAVFICQAWGLPAFGVGQPAHACVAYRSGYPSAEPQPGCRWKVAQGRGWAASKLDGMSGNDFFAGIIERERRDDFAQVEHLRWLASAAPAAAQPAVLNVVRAVQKVSAAAAAAEASSQKDPVIPAPAIKPEPPFAAKPGVIHVEAEAFAKMSGVSVLDCYTGGKQVNFGQSANNSSVEYALDVPAAGTYAVTMRTAAVNVDQTLNIVRGTNTLATVKVPQTHGLWGTTEEVEIRLDKGAQTLGVSAPFQRGVALRWLELKAK